MKNMVTVLLLGTALADLETKPASVVIAPSGSSTEQQGTVGALLTMGEAMIRFAPIDINGLPPDATRHEPHPFLRSIGGDELNVAVALQLLGVQSRWISVLPEGPLGEVITASCMYHGVEFAGALIPDADVCRARS